MRLEKLKGGKVAQILACTDNADRLHDYERELSACGQTYFIADSLIDLATHIKKNAAPLSLILCDAHMIDGVRAALRQGEASGHNTQLFVVKDMDITLTAEQVISFKALHLIKPVFVATPQCLRDTIAQIFMPSPGQKIRKAYRLAKIWKTDKPNGNFREQPYQQPQGCFHADR